MQIFGLAGKGKSFDIKWYDYKIFQTNCAWRGFKTRDSSYNMLLKSKEEKLRTCLFCMPAVWQ